MEENKNVKNNETKDLSVTVSNVEQFFEKNSKWILICVGVIVLAVVLYFLLLRPALQNRERNAAADSFKAEYWFDQSGNWRSTAATASTSSDLPTWCQRTKARKPTTWPNTMQASAA